MPRLLAPLFAPLLALALLSACQLSLPGRDRAPDTAPNPVTGGAITTTTLDAPAPPAANAATATAPAATATATAASPTDPRPQPRPETAGQAAETTTAEVPAEPTAEPAPEIPAALKSPSQIACEDDDGTWARAGEGGGMACVYQTRDGGKRCDSKDDCEGECLARSRSCSPIQPLFGCNAVLLDTGAEVTLCLD
ncbi:MAG: hypothetical protein O9292_17570 [Rhodobacteraceae bacterium]|nr:hypothetical protein [Paracoccaceae bacterium]